VDLSEQEFINDYFAESSRALKEFISFTSSSTSIITFADAITAAIDSGGKTMIAGNGGSAADAQHIAAEFVSRLFFDHAPLAALALTTDTSILTAVGNDYGYEHVFERQVLGLGRPGDVFLGISTSGRSRNVLLAFEAARSRGMVTLGFAGDSSPEMEGLCDHVLHVPSSKTAIIQQIHIISAHLICGLVEERVFGHRFALKG
jgi:D-sedoheptulose 7-phosphate isomerase